MIDKIINTSDWISVDQIPGGGTQLHQQYLKDLGVDGQLSGVYQIVLRDDIDNVGDDLVHPAIGYTGMGKDVFVRTSSGIRPAGGTHGVNKYIKHKGWNKSDVMVRFHITKPGDERAVEDEIHSMQKDETGERFAWTKASAGKDGRVVDIKDKMLDCSLDELEEIMGEFEGIWHEVSTREADARLNQCLKR